MPQKAVPEIQNRCPLLNFSGKTDWNAFRAHFELLADAAGWSEKHNVLQLALCLSDDAAAC